jgi:hypothetical protein
LRISGLKTFPGREEKYLKFTGFSGRKAACGN